MPTARIVAKIPALSGIPADAIQMTLHAHRPVATSLAITVAEAHALNGAMAHFLEDLVSDNNGGTRSLGSLLANDLDRSAVLLETYDAATGGSPIASDAPPGALQAAAVATDVPREVSVCLSYRGDYGAAVEAGAAFDDLPTDEAAQDEGAPATHHGRIRPRSRLRGRVFVGPLCNFSVLGSPARPGGVMRGVILNAFWSGFKPAVEAITLVDQWHPAVWSKRNGTAVDVSNAWVDDAFDTQRRRGVKPTGRIVKP